MVTKAYDDDNRGILNINASATGKQPQFKGKAVINGEEYTMAGWERDGSYGTFISIVFKLASQDEYYQKDQYKKDKSKKEAGF